MPYEFAPGLTVTIVPPAIPSMLTSPPSSSVSAVPLIGPQGPPGVTGPAGVSVNAGFLHTQISASQYWPVTHNLGFYPAGFHIKDSTGDIIEPASITYLNVNSLIIDVGRSMSGTAQVS